MNISFTEKFNELIIEKKSFLKQEEERLKEEMHFLDKAKEILLSKKKFKDIEISEIFYELIKDLSLPKKEQIIAMCGFSNKLNVKEVKVKQLDKIINNIKKKYGNEIKFGSWEGIKETIEKEKILNEKIKQVKK